MDAAVDRGGIDGSKFELTYREVRATRESLTRRWREQDSNRRSPAIFMRKQLIDQPPDYVPDLELGRAGR